MHTIGKKSSILFYINIFAEIVNRLKHLPRLVVTTAPKNSYKVAIQYNEMKIVNTSTSHLSTFKYVLSATKSC